MRPVTVLAFAVALGLGPALAQTTGSINPARAQVLKPEARPAAPGFDGFLRTLWPMAQARGISRKTFEMSLDKVESVDVNQSILGRLMNYGDVTIQGVGEGTQTIATIARPLSFRSAITARPAGT